MHFMEVAILHALDVRGPRMPVGVPAPQYVDARQSFLRPVDTNVAQEVAQAVAFVGSCPTLPPVMGEDVRHAVQDQGQHLVDV